MSGFNLLGGSGPSTGDLINNVQNITVNLPANTLTQTVTISEVDLSRTFVIINTLTTSNASGNSAVTAVLTNSNTLTLSRRFGSMAVECSVAIVESPVANVQSNFSEIPLSVSNREFNINTVDTSRCLVFFSQSHNSQSSTSTNITFVNYQFVSSNVIRFNFVSNAIYRDFNFFVVEFP